jgi:hypothetical protein
MFSYYHNMVIRQQLRNILSRIAERTQSDVNKTVPDTWIIDDAGLPEFETRKHLNELQSLDMIRIDQRMSGTADGNGREYRMIGIAKEGIKASASDDDIPR